MTNKNKINVLVIDDEVAETIKENLEDFKLGDAYLSIDAFDSSIEAIKRINRLKQDKRFHDVVIVDMKMEGSEARGIDVLKLPLPSVKIVMTALANVDNCINCLRLGAFDYIDKNSLQYDPMERLRESIRDGLSRRKQKLADPFSLWLQENLERLTREYEDKYIATIGEIVVDCAGNKHVLKKRVKEKYPYFDAEIVKLH